MILTFKRDLHSDWVNQHAKYLGQRLYFYSYSPDTHTYTTDCST